MEEQKIGSCHLASIISNIFQYLRGEFKDDTEVSGLMADRKKGGSIFGNFFASDDKDPFAALGEENDENKENEEIAKKIDETLEEFKKVIYIALQKCIHKLFKNFSANSVDRWIVTSSGSEVLYIGSNRIRFLEILQEAILMDNDKINE